MSETLKKATRDGFGDEIVALGKENSNILVVDVDIGKSCKTGAFRKELPEQYLNVGNAVPIHPLKGLQGIGHRIPERESGRSTAFQYIPQ